MTSFFALINRYTMNTENKEWIILPWLRSVTCNPGWGGQLSFERQNILIVATCKTIQINAVKHNLSGSYMYHNQLTFKF
mgnify:CR=1 FL=1